MTKQSGSIVIWIEPSDRARRSMDVSMISSAQASPAPAALTISLPFVRCPRRAASRSNATAEAMSSRGRYPPSTGICICPTSRLSPFRPVTKRPRWTMPPPIPVEIVRKTMSLALPAPSRYAPQAAACASFSAMTFAFKRSDSLSISGKPGGIGRTAGSRLHHRPPLTAPVAATPAISKLPRQSAANWAMSFNQTSGPRVFCVAIRRLSTISSPATNATSVLVPPMSTAKVG